jgi:oligopeptide/dipeptide ABC transporter ATP-binding protein
MIDNSTSVSDSTADENVFVGKEEEIVLDVQNLSTYFKTEEGIVRAVEDVSFFIRKNEVLGLVGETGCGKSVTALSIIRLVRAPGKIVGGRVLFEGQDLVQKPENEMQGIRGKNITMIFQDPMNSLNPVFTVQFQLNEVFKLHQSKELIEMAKKDGHALSALRKNILLNHYATLKSLKALEDVRIPDPQKVLRSYPHELSGGMRQRVMIAMSLACNPELLIADEPTTALDVTIQAQILDLLRDLKRRVKTSILIITHDLGVIAEISDRVAVMYSGNIIELGDVFKLFSDPKHPYTQGLISAIPRVEHRREKLTIIPGSVPNLIHPPTGCRFHPRCQYRKQICIERVPDLIETSPGYFVKCYLHDPRFEQEMRSDT